MHAPSRRRFLQLAAAAGTVHALGRLPGVAHAEVALSAAPSADYKALVCVFLFGGNDSWNMLVPRDAAEYAAYARSRRSMAIPADRLIAAAQDRATTDPRAYGWHPSLEQIARLFDEGACAAIANVGTLLQPTTRDQIVAGTARLPPHLFSHNDQRDQWSALSGESAARSGWAGRIADALEPSGAELPLNVSLSGQALLQVGESKMPYAMGPAGPVPFYGLEGADPGAVARRAAFERVLRAERVSAYGQAFAAMQERALAMSRRMNEALAFVRAQNSPPFATEFPPTALGTQLRTVAELIAARERIGASRQVFHVQMGGFDTHDAQAQLQPQLYADLSASLASFHAATAELGTDRAVTAFTMSDFGRTLTSNGDGTDHGWGSVQLVLGGAVNGRRLYGRYPRLEIDGPDDAGAGRIIPTTAVDQYVASAATY
jgi:uncharacterized protein (DUF1501 family)